MMHLINASKGLAAVEASFWQQRWASGQIGFHESAFHPMLLAHGARLAPGARVFVPLCGKSHDMLWLRAQGHGVVGIELAEIAVEAFFAEHNMTPQRSHAAPFVTFRADDITLLCGDIFALTTAALGEFNAIYDRAALIALPPDMRREYATRISALAAPATRMLLITVGYDPHTVSPPPFAVSATDVTSLYAEHWVMEELATRQAEVKGQAGTEQAWLLTRRDSQTVRSL